MDAPRFPPTAPPSRPGARRFRTRGWFAGALATAAIALAFLAGAQWGSLRAPWKVTSVGGRGYVVLAGRAYSLTRPASLEHALARGGRLRVAGEASLLLSSPGRLTMLVGPRTDVELPPPPRGWNRDVLSVVLRTGELRVTSARSMEPVTLLLQTPESAIETYGTTLSLVRTERGTGVRALLGDFRDRHRPPLERAE
jgi:hypothetical protein